MAVLVAVEGPVKGTQLALAEHQVVLVGRDERCTFQILDPQVSRRHLQIKRLPGGGAHVAVDFESTNGVLVNGSRIDGQAPLHNGDTIHLGGTVFVYMAADSPDAKTIEDLLHKRGEHIKQTMPGGGGER